jgi:hypothetical protein
MNFQVVSDYPGTSRKPLKKLTQGIIDGEQFH